MTVLVTGSTSAQVNPKAHRNAANFTGLLVRALAEQDYNVRWCDPSMSWTATELLDSYEHVVVGLAPVTSMSANRIYGALSVIGHMLENAPQKLSVVLDAPEPQRIGASFRAIIEHPENLCKPFYSYRKEYPLAVAQTTRLLAVVTRLHTQAWPRTVVPGLPWHQGSHVASQLPYAVKKLVYMNLDAALIDSYRSQVASGRRHGYWLSEADTQRVLRYPVKQIARRGGDGWDRGVLRDMCLALGFLDTAKRFGTWWTPRFAQALASETPVCSDWKETKVIGNYWSFMPSQVEDIKAEDRLSLARGQATQYLAGIEKFGSVHDQVCGLLNKRIYK